MKSVYVHASSIREERHYRKSKTRSQTRHFSYPSGVRTRWTMLDRFYGVLQLIAQCSRSLIRWENSWERWFGDAFSRTTVSHASEIEYHPISTKDQARLHQCGRKVSSDYFSELFSLEVGNWKGDILAADVEELQNNAASLIYFKRPNSKEVIVSKEGDVFAFHCADFSKNWKEEVARSKHPTNFGKIPKWNRTLMWTSGETDDPDPAKQLWEQHDLKTRHHVWSTRGKNFYRHQVQARIKFYMPKGGSWPRGKGSSRLERQQAADSRGVRNWERASTLGTEWRRREGRANERPDGVPFSRRGGVPPVSRQGHRRKRRQDLLLGHWRGHHHNEKMPHESRNCRACRTHFFRKALVSHLCFVPILYVWLKKTSHRRFINLSHQGIEYDIGRVARKAD